MERENDRSAMLFSDEDDDYIEDTFAEENLSTSDRDRTVKSRRPSGESSTDDENEGPMEDRLIVSRATRLSIHGVISVDNASEESDYIQSDDETLIPVPGGSTSEVAQGGAEANDNVPGVENETLCPLPVSEPAAVQPIPGTSQGPSCAVQPRWFDKRAVSEPAAVQPIPGTSQGPSCAVQPRRFDKPVSEPAAVQPIPGTSQGPSCAVQPRRFDKSVSEPAALQPIPGTSQGPSCAVQPRRFDKPLQTVHDESLDEVQELLTYLYQSLASRPPESSQYPAPSSMRTPLMEHQLHALAWLRWRETQRPKGGILADDMGLGKTVSTLALVLSDIEDRIPEDNPQSSSALDSTRLAGGTLIVCPASLVRQWSNEIARHCQDGALSVCVYHGKRRLRDPVSIVEHDVVITTYHIVLRDYELISILMDINWHRVVLDEAHVVRNYKAAMSVAVCGLISARRWCLTGTPVQNKDLDLFALVKFLKCTPFDNLRMWLKWMECKSPEAHVRLSTLLQCIVLRRTKEHLQGTGMLTCLPSRQTHRVEVTLKRLELKAYHKVLQFSKSLFQQYLQTRLAQRTHDQCRELLALHGSKHVLATDILIILLRLRQICCHCGLLAIAMADISSDTTEGDPTETGQGLLATINSLSLNDTRDSLMQETTEAASVLEGIVSIAEALRAVLPFNNHVFDLRRSSSKLDAVMDCLERVCTNKDDKVIIISQWTTVLKLVEYQLERKSIQCVMLTGDLSIPARQRIVDSFNNEAANDVRIMLMSLCAGGIGLNLCGANHLLFIDPHWNPQLEAQAQDRIYRVGQKKAVHIYRFVCKDTVEESIEKLQQSKLELAKTVLTGARQMNNSKLTIEDLQILFDT